MEISSIHSNILHLSRALSSDSSVAVPITGASLFLVSMILILWIYILSTKRDHLEKVNNKDMEDTVGLSCDEMTEGFVEVRIDDETTVEDIPIPDNLITNILLLTRIKKKEDWLTSCNSSIESAPSACSGNVDEEDRKHIEFDMHDVKFEKDEQNLNCLSFESVESEISLKTEYFTIKDAKDDDCIV